MAEIYFVYGLAFFTFGVALLVRTPPSTTLFFRPAMRCLAGFGLLHGLTEWLEMARLTEDLDFGARLESRTAAVGVSGYSFIFLAGAGLHLTVDGKPSWSRPVVIFLLGAIAAWTLILTLTLWLNAPIEPADVAARWLLGAPGAIAVGYAFARMGYRSAVQGATKGQADRHEASMAYMIGGSAILLYGLTTFFGPALSWPPAAQVNAENFDAWFGFPIQILRTLLTLIATGAIMTILTGFGVMERAALQTTIKQALEGIQEQKDLLRDSEQRFRGVFDNNLVASIIIDQKGRIRGFNSAATKLFGYDEADVLRHQVELLMPEPHRSEHKSHISRYLETGEAGILGVAPRRLPAVHKDGHVFDAVFDITEFKTETGAAYFVAAIKPADESAN